MEGFQSSVSLQVDNFNNFQVAIPHIPTSSKYCKIDNTLGIGLSNYTFLYILNDNECVELFLKCSSDGVLSSFPEFGCNGEPIKYVLLRNPILIDDPYELGTVHAYVADLNGGGAEIGWTAFHPVNDLVPNHKSFFEILATILFILSLIICTSGVWFWGYKYRNRTLAGFIMFVASPIALLFYLIARVVLYYVIFVDFNALLYFTIFKNLTFAVSTLLSSISTTMFLGSVTSFTKFQNNTIYIVLGCIHMFFCGSDYFTFSSLLPSDFDEFYYFVTNWNNLELEYYWILLLLVWNLIPLIATVWKFTKFHGETLKGRIQASNELDKWFLPLLSIQSLFFVLYFLCGYFQNYSSILESDRNFLAVESLKSFCLIMHVIDNCILIERAKIMFVNSKAPMKRYLKKKVTEKAATTKPVEQISAEKSVSMNLAMTKEINRPPLPTKLQRGTEKVNADTSIGRETTKGEGYKEKKIDDQNDELNIGELKRYLKKKAAEKAASTEPVEQISTEKSISMNLAMTKEINRPPAPKLQRGTEKVNADTSIGREKTNGEGYKEKKAAEKAASTEPVEQISTEKSVSMNLAMTKEINSPPLPTKLQRGTGKVDAESETAKGKGYKEKKIDGQNDELHIGEDTMQMNTLFFRTQKNDENE
jgi:hypothetical protein